MYGINLTYSHIDWLIKYMTLYTHKTAAYDGN